MSDFRERVNEVIRQERLIQQQVENERLRQERQWQLESQQLENQRQAYIKQLWSYLNGLYVPTLLKNFQTQLWRGRGELYYYSQSWFVAYRLAFTKATIETYTSQASQGGHINYYYYKPPLKGFYESYVEVGASEAGIQIQEGLCQLVGIKESHWFMDSLFPKGFSRDELRMAITGEVSDHRFKNSTYQKYQLPNPSWQDIENTLVQIGVQRKKDKRFPY